MFFTRVIKHTLSKNYKVRRLIVVSYGTAGVIFVRAIKNNVFLQPYLHYY